MRSIRSALSVAAATYLTLVFGGEPRQLRVDVTSGPEDCDPSDRVTEGRFLRVHFVGYVFDIDDSSSSSSSPSDAIGRIFESSREPPARTGDGAPSQEPQEPQPVAFRIGVGSMIPGWERGLMGLCSNSNVTLIVPPEMAYGDAGLPAREDSVGSDGEEGTAAGGVPPGATLRFDVEILSVDDDPPHKDEGTEGGERGEEDEPNVFDMLDEDGDGKLNEEEVKAFFQIHMGMDDVPPELWENEDRDKDGFISWHEFGGPKGRSPPTPSSSGAGPDEPTEEEEEEPPKREDFDAIDNNGDLLLSTAEVKALFEQRGEDMPPDFWDREDADGDGYISLVEFGLSDEDIPLLGSEDIIDPQKQFEMIDKDEDGRLSHEEVDAFFRDTTGAGEVSTDDGAPEGFWDEEDSDGDGYISPEEFLGGLEPVQSEFIDVDVDGDGMLSKEEVEKFFAEKGQEVPEGLWRDEDADQDGFMSREEFDLSSGGGKDEKVLAQGDEL